MRRFRTIIQTPSEPQDHQVLWYHEGKLLYFENGAWIPLLSTDTQCSDVSNLQGVVNVTYAELLNQRNQGKLVGGVLYRITDYITTVGNDHEVESAGHPFDIIVLALDQHTLSEHAYAANSSRDTNGHFAKSKLSAWQVWYCLDNDVTRFQWADTTNGKGVIYRLIDEWNNDCPYDFKNIQFARYPTQGEFWDNLVAQNSDIKFPSYVLGRNMFFNGLEIEDERYVDYFYTFTNYQDSHIDDASLLHKVADDIQNCYSLACSNNKIEPYLIAQVIDGTTYQTMALNNIVLIAFDNDNGNSVQLYGNYWNTGCYNMTFQDKCYGNTFGTNCSCWVAFTFLYNTIGSNCSQNLFGYYTVNNSFGSHFCTNTFGEGCVLSTFGNECLHNTFEGKCSRSSFGNACSGNTFGSTAIASDGYLYCCEAYTFGNQCEQNTFNCLIPGCTIGNKVSFLSILCDPSETGPGQIHILDGTQGTESNTLVVEIPYSTTQVCRYIGKNSKGELKIWTPADNIS